MGALFAASIGVIVAQIGMVSLTQGIGIGGWGFVLALLLAFGIAMANAMAYAEMALMMPSAGSLSSYAEAALGNFPAILLVFAGYVTPAIFGVPAELILADQILAQAIPIHLPALSWSVGIVLVFTILNILGTDVFAKVQTILSVVVLAFLVLSGGLALSGLGSAAPQLGAGLDMATFGKDPVTLGVAALAFWVFVGSEFVTPLVTEARNARRDLPRAMLGGLLVIFVAQMLYALGSAALISRANLVGSATPHLDYAVATFGGTARVWFALLALLATSSLINTVLAAVPRMLLGMAQNGQVFPIFKHVHPRWGTPVVAIAFVACLPLIGLAWSGGDVNAILPLMIAASISWLLAYMMAQISLIVLRRRYPNAVRPYRVPGYPVTPLLAITGMAVVVLKSSPDPSMTGQIAEYTGMVLAVFALIGALWVKRIMKKNLFQPAVPAGLEEALAGRDQP
jgi:amino acid transporter